MNSGQLLVPGRPQTADVPHFESMEGFLADSKKQLRNPQLDVVHIVLGNEACDLDSIVSSLIYGLFLSVGKLSDKPTIIVPSDCHHSDLSDETTSVLNETCSGSILSKAVIPVLNIPKDDFNLRTEAVYLLQRVGVHCSNLTFITDIDLDYHQANKKLQLTLVDHNLLAQHQKGLAESVVEIIDHHNDDWAGKTPVKKIIEPVGSCATLVAERILDLMPSLLDKQMVTLLLATIALDSVNLDPRAGRATEKDCAVVERLQSLDCSLKESRDELYKSVSKAKFDVKNLSVLDLLRKDYKSLSRTEQNPVGIGICSVGGMHLAEFFARENVSEDSERFCSRRQLDVLIVMTIYFPSFDDPPMRQVAVCGRHPKVEEIADFLFRSEQLKLSKLDNLCSPNCVAFDQNNITASRKVLLPLVNSFILGGSGR